MRKSITAATVAASITIGGLAGAVLGAPGFAGAAETAAGAVSWVDEALSGLVEDGTITQAQADAVETALEEARPERVHGSGRFYLEEVAEVLGMTTDELRAALVEDTTLAEIAEAEGVSVDTVIDAIVAAQEAHLDEKVAAGDLTQEEADERLANAEERATAIVNGEMRARGGRRFGGRGA